MPERDDSRDPEDLIDGCYRPNADSAVCQFGPDITGEWIAPSCPTLGREENRGPSTPPKWRLVTHESPRHEHNAVRRMDEWLSRELGMVPLGWRPETAAKHPDYEAWLLDSRPTGGAIFTRGGFHDAAWHLDRVWLAPHLRRRGLLSAVWPTWTERYGTFSTEPSTDGFKRFLLAQGSWGPVTIEGSGSPIPTWMWIASDEEANR